MKVGDITRKLRHCSAGTIEIHIYDKGSRLSETLSMTPAEIARVQNQNITRFQDPNKEYPFGATLESIDYVQGKLIINGSLSRR